LAKNHLEELKEFLKEKIKELKRELEFYEFMLSIIEGGKLPGFREPRPGERIIEIKSSTGDLIAYMYVGKGYVRIIPLADISINDPYVKGFLLRVLDETKVKEAEAARRGEIPENKILDYDVKAEDGILREIIVRNIKGEFFLLELKAAVAYSFEKAKHITA